MNHDRCKLMRSKKLNLLSLDERYYLYMKASYKTGLGSQLNFPFTASDSRLTYQKYILFSLFAWYFPVFLYSHGLSKKS